MLVEVLLVTLAASLVIYFYWMDPLAPVDAVLHTLHAAVLTAGRRIRNAVASREAERTFENVAAFLHIDINTLMVNLDMALARFLDVLFYIKQFSVIAFYIIYPASRATVALLIRNAYHVVERAPLAFFEAMAIIEDVISRATNPLTAQAVIVLIHVLLLWNLLSTAIHLLRTIMVVLRAVAGAATIR